MKRYLQLWIPSMTPRKRVVSVPGFFRRNTPLGGHPTKPPKECADAQNFSLGVANPDNVTQGSAAAPGPILPDVLQGRARILAGAEPGARPAPIPLRLVEEAAVAFPLAPLRRVPFVGLPLHCGSFAGRLPCGRGGAPPGPGQSGIIASA